MYTTVLYILYNLLLLDIDSSHATLYKYLLPSDSDPFVNSISLSSPIININDQQILYNIW
jgi:hypothetical protein